MHRDCFAALAMTVLNLAEYNGEYLYIFACIIQKYVLQLTQMRSKKSKYINRTVDMFRLLIRLALCFIITIVLLCFISCKQSSAPAADITPEPTDTPIPSQAIIDDVETEAPIPISPDKLPLPETYSTPFGRMAFYVGKRIPLIIQYPAEWVESENPDIPPSYPLTLRHSKDGLSQLTITEPSFADLGLSSMSLDEYVELVISTNMNSIPDFKLISEDYIELDEDAKARLIVFSSENGQRMFYRLIYIHDDNFIFNFTYAYRPLIEDIASIVSYSFSTILLNPVIPKEPIQNSDAECADISECIERGITLLDKGFIEEAINVLDKAVELDPTSSKAYFYRGLASEDAGNIEQAIADYTKSAELNPEDNNAYYNLGCIYSFLMQYDKAIANYTKNIEHNSAYVPQSYFNRSKVYFHTFKIDMAISDVSKAIELVPDYVKAYDQRALYYAIKNEFDKAIQDHNKAIELDPEWMHLYYNRAVTYKNMGQIELAINDLNKIIETSNDPVDIAQAKALLEK